jgi:hypothetical protein
VLQHSRRKAAGRWRRWTFVTWIALTLVAAAYILVTAPFASYFDEEMWMVGVIVPPLMIVLLAGGIGWLVWLVTSSRRPDDRSAAR